MKVLIYSAGTDNAGVGISLKRAFDRASTEWEAHFVRRRDNQWHYPADIELYKGDEVTGRFVERLIAEADVIHLLQRPTLLAAGKPHIVHHLGSYYRDDPAGVSAACDAIGAVQVMGGLDMMLLGKPMEFLPIAADIEGVRRIADKIRKSLRPNAGKYLTNHQDRPIRIAHAPTNRVFKSTDVIVETVERLARSYPIEFDLIEGVPWAECIRRKAQADIYVDELTNGYGVNALECWAMRIPVVSGLADNRVRELMVGMFGGTPFMDVSAVSLYRGLESLVTDPDLRSSVGRQGWNHIQRVHSSQAVVDKAVDIYERAMAQAQVA